MMIHQIPGMYTLWSGFKVLSPARVSAQYRMIYSFTWLQMPASFTTK